VGRPLRVGILAPISDGRRIRYVGSVGPAERDALLGGARTLLHLIGFAEPFGLSVVEAMALRRRARAGRCADRPAPERARLLAT
jgi:hypothetical protein